MRCCYICACSYEYAPLRSQVAECPELVRGLFFHHVSEKDWQQYGEAGLPLPADKTIDGVPVSYFRTYVGAARKAFKLGLLGPEELLRVIEQSQLDLQHVARDDLKWADLRRDRDVAVMELGRFLEQQRKQEGWQGWFGKTTKSNQASVSNDA